MQIYQIKGVGSYEGAIYTLNHCSTTKEALPDSLELRLQYKLS